MSRHLDDPAPPEAGTAQCPTLLVSAPASGQGKTMVTAALARLHRKAGRCVRVFKCGPDFLDPMILERASGAPVHQLDLFMVGEDRCRRLLHEAAAEADVIFIEGVMGLFDGAPSAADLAVRFGLPVMAVIDGSAMAQTFGAVAHGLATYRSDLHLAAVLANRVGSQRHAAMLEASLPSGISWLGSMARSREIAFPERHLGVMQAAEITDIDARLDIAAASLPGAAAWLPDPVPFAAPAAAEATARLLDGVRIAIARDEAFAFIYPANLDCLRQMGATLTFFSPLRDAELPPCDALWLPGGYPELHAPRLARNTSLIAALRDHHAAGKPILAECGGLLYCLDSLRDVEGTLAPMAGLMPGKASMRPRLAALGMQQADLPGGRLRGHTFHYSALETGLTPIASARTPDGRPGEAIYRSGSLTASYMHFYFHAAPAAAARLFLR